MEVAQERKMILPRVSAFLNKHYALFFAPIIVVFLYIFALWQYNVYPFGVKYTAASYDLSAQICPFIEHLFDVFDGKSTLTFSYAIVGGADVTGTFLYFFISPFSFLFLIFGDGKVAHASSIVMLCKLASISVAGAWFSSKLFKNIPDYISIAVGVVYTYCGYTFVSNTYINWMDFLIYLPFCAGAFKHFVQTGKYLPFSILVACCIYTCFSIACFSLFTVFPCLVFYGLIYVKKEERNQFIAYLCLSFLVALLLSLPILLPALGAYTVSGREGDLFENLWKGFTVNEVTGIPESFNSSTFGKSYAESLYRKFSYIISDTIFVVLTAIWLYRRGIKDKFAQFMLAAGVLTLLPVFVDESMNLLNMGSYMSYALRFGFLNALYFLGGACLCLDSLHYKPLTAIDGMPLFYNVQKSPSEGNEGGRYALNRFFAKENRKSSLFAVGYILIGIIATTVLLLLLWIMNESISKKAVDYQPIVRLFVEIFGKGFSGSYAHSLGGLEIIIILFIVVAVVAVVGAFFVGSKWISPRLTSIVLLVVVGTQVFFYNNQLVLGNRSTQHNGLSTYAQLYDEIEKYDEGYYRVADYNNTYTACAPFTAGSNSFSVFSSVIDANNFVTAQLFGFDGNSKNSYKSGHNPQKYNRCDEFGYSFLGYKYIISNNNPREYKVYDEDLKKDKTVQEDMTVKDIKGLKEVPKRNEKGEILMQDGGAVQLSKNEMYVYENTNVFPLGYRVKRGAYSFVEENISNSSHRQKNQKALYEYLLGEKSEDNSIGASEVAKLSKVLHERAATVEVGAGKITAKVTAEEGEDLLLSFVAVKGYSVTVNGESAEIVDNDLKFLQVRLEEGVNEVVFTYSSPYGTYALVGVGGGLLLLCAVALVVNKTRFMQKAGPVISWAGILLSVGVVAFFMIYPTGVFLSKLIQFLL